MFASFYVKTYGLTKRKDEKPQENGHLNGETKLNGTLANGTLTNGKIHNGTTNGKLTNGYVHTNGTLDSRKVK